MKLGVLVILILLSSFSLSVNLGAQSEPLTVKVEDPSGLPVEGAAVSVLLSSGLELATSRTQASGKVDLIVARGSYELRVSAPGFKRFRQEFVLRPGASLDLVVQLELASLATEISVVATQPGLIAVEEIPEAALESGPPRDLAGKLKQVPGVLALRRGSTNLDPVVQGLREYQVAMVIDGSRTFAAGPARMDSEICHVDPAQVDGLEVIKGPYALTEGSGALSAILVSTDPVPVHDELTFGGTVSTGYSFNGTNRFGHTRFFAASRKFGVSLRVSGGKGNNFSPGRRHGLDESVPGRYGQYQVGGKMRVNLTPSQEFTFDSGFDTQTDLDYPGRLLNAVHFITRSWNGAYYLKEPASSIQSIHLGLYLNKKSHRMTNDGKPTALDMPGRIPPLALDVSLPTESDTLGGAARVQFQPKDGWTTETGFDFYNLDQEAVRFVSGRSDGVLLFRDNVWPDARTQNQGFYLHSARAGEGWGMAASLRFDLVQADALSPSDFFLANTLGDLNQDEFHASFSLTGRRRLASGVMLSGGFGRVVRTANTLERYSDRFPSSRFQIAAEFMGSPAIRPETSYQGDMGLELSWAGVTVHGGAFYRRIEDFIAVAPAPEIPRRLPLSPPLVFRYLSGDHANFRGLDFGFRAPLLAGLEFRGQGAYTLADDIEQSVVEIGMNEPVLGIPPFEIRSKLLYLSSTQPLWGELEMRNVWNQDQVAGSRLETPSPGFSTLSLRGGLTLPRRVSLQLGVENLADKFYFEHLNSLNPFLRQRIPEPGRTVFLGLAKKW